MSTIAGLPAHPLLVHAIVVFVPLLAVLEVLCGFWPAARRRLVWLVLALAAVTAVLAPITQEAGEWLYNRSKQPSEILQTHAERGEWMVYVAIALLVVAIALAVVHWLETRSDRGRLLISLAVGVVALVVGVASVAVVVAVGDSGSRAAWHKSVS